jgi:hypothetical protein
MLTRVLCTCYRGHGHMETAETSLVIFQNAGQAVEVWFDTTHDTVWLTQRQMADLLETSTDNVSLHLKNVFDAGELLEDATTEESSVVRQEGNRKVTRKVKRYNLDAIISVGYRVSCSGGSTITRQTQKGLNGPRGNHRNFRA